MITTGLVKELRYCSKVLSTPITVNINFTEYNTETLWINIYPEEFLTVYFQRELIWRESIKDDGFFGIESCDSIARIIRSIQENNNVITENIRNMFYIENVSS